MKYIAQFGSVKKKVATLSAGAITENVANAKEKDYRFIRQTKYSQFV